MLGAKQDSDQVFRQRLAALVAAPAADNTSLFVRVLEMLRDACLETPDAATADMNDEQVQRLLTAANQLLLGLLYHLAHASSATSDLECLQRQVEAGLRELHAGHAEVASYKQRLHVLNADLEMLREERGLLEDVAAHAALRERLQSQQGGQEAYHRLLTDAARRAKNERAVLEQLSRQVEDLLQRGRELLRDELLGAEAQWRAVETEVFGA